MGERNAPDRLTAGRKAAGRAESVDSTVGDPRVRQLQRGLGNDELRQQLDQGRADRGTMLAHVIDRLGVIEELQSRELRLLDRGATFEWWRAVSRDDNEDVSVPDPNHWHEVARTYKLASEALCAGNLGRGHELLERAMKLDDHEVDKMTELVDTTGVDFETRPDVGVLDGLVGVGNVEPCAPPEGIEVADRILSIQVDIHRTPEVRKGASPWWGEDEEEDEEDGAGDGGGDAGGG